MHSFASRLLARSFVFMLLLAASLLAASLLAASTAFAQDGERPTAEEVATNLTIGLVNHVGLTPQQTTQVRPIMQAHATQMLGIMPENPNMISMMRVRGQMSELQETTTAQLVPLLTDEQAEHLDDYWDEQRKAMRERMGR